MNEQKKNTKKRKKYNPVVTFFKIVVSMVLVFCVAAGGAVFAYQKVTGGSKPETTPTKGSETSFIDALLKKGIKLNVAVFGVDGEGTRTDVMFVVQFDSKQGTTGVVSVPRDTRVTLTDEIKTYMKEENKYYQSPTKLNAVHAYAGKNDKGCEMAVLQIEDLLGISIDHYVKVDLSAFRKIVDTIGGVEVDVPQDMFYEDPYQDLYINLKAGPQLLDGDKAEQLVRFRRYPQGDVARVEVQQLFINEFVKKVMSTESIIKNLPDYISMLYTDIKTDVTLVDALKYANYIEFIDTSKIFMDTLPGEGQTIDGASYYIHDPVATQELVDKVFYGITLDSENASAASSKDLMLEVSNGGVQQGLAGKIGQKLKEEGYQISGVSTYTGEKKDYTRIIVKEEEMGLDLKKYFEGSKVEVDSSLLSAETDIKIILGLNER